ncbi:MAG: histidine phosphatase family protein [Ktedonobacterales bacterium]
MPPLGFGKRWRRLCAGRSPARYIRYIRYIRYVRDALPIVHWYLHVGFAGLWVPRTRRGFTKWLMEITESTKTELAGNPGNKALPADKPLEQPDGRVRVLFLVRHGQTTFNVEGRLPGQLPGIPLTDEGRRQAQRAAVALSGLPLSAVISSPLERARDTADIIARGWALPVMLDPRLMDLDVGAWSGQKVEDLNKSDPLWRAFVERPNQPPEGVESFLALQSRAVASVEETRKDPTLGQYVVLIAHADPIKLLLAHYTGLDSERARFLVIGNASISALAFPPEGEPHLLALNWNALPEWLSPVSAGQVERSAKSSATDSDEAAAVAGAVDVT